MISERRSTVLVIEDDDGERRVLDHLFARHSPAVDVVFADAPDEAIGYLSAGHVPDLVVIAGEHREAPPRALLEALRARPERAEIPVYVFSTHDRPEARALWRDAAVEDFVTKPFTLDGYRDFVARIAAHVTGYTPSAARTG